MEQDPTLIDRILDQKLSMQKYEQVFDPIKLVSGLRNEVNEDHNLSLRKAIGKLLWIFLVLRVYVLCRLCLFTILGKGFRLFKCFRNLY